MLDDIRVFLPCALRVLDSLVWVLVHSGTIRPAESVVNYRLYAASPSTPYCLAFISLPHNRDQVPTIS
jgi:hypothetical protein